ncbi:DUF5641 domain-containing protein [Trichonephila inaurata madagascariensis]|uniref:DUF5641 domain-containing protein n=1 Tax=Trichonephila inaurata madagascariensis TaxID=2747483 RepID=A0A8X6XU94_9ARAC|nr:DUF5641 domain-containing protein [Trichonephila inaurata madagascariensis]
MKEPPEENIITDFPLSYDRLLRVTAWMYRFFTNCKIEKSKRIIGVSTLEEMNRAEIHLLKIVQKESFSGTDDKRLKAIQCYVDPNVSRDNTKRIEWPLAKVMELYPSKDGSIRLVKVKMKSGEFLRPVLRLIPLEVTQKVDLGKPPVDRIFPTNEPTGRSLLSSSKKLYAQLGLEQTLLWPL